MFDRRQILAGSAAAVAMAAAPGSLLAQIGQPARIIFPFTAGGSGDALARMIADKLRVGLDQTVIVENRAGAAGRIGVQAVKSSPPDGKTLLLTPIAPVAVYQHVYQNLGYDPITDLMPVAHVSSMEFALAVANNTNVTSMQELLAWIKANPAQANYGTPGAGTLPHFFMVLFAKAANLDLQHVMYKGSAGAVADLAGGQVPMVLTTVPDVLSLHKAGKVRVIAVSGEKRSTFIPEAPTFIEAGYKISGDSWYALFAPAGTPRDVVSRINTIVVDALKTPEMVQAIANIGMTATGSSPEQLAEIQKRDAAFWAPAVEASGFKPEN